eukprot:CAMPEP_0196586390 /NCGR_PEP_ID=MMETSP1081-20130531/54091_1 /TAXON_ID=36882 /ORGANISM="Pyramimonas amylifera, Strain CCMP720" /LENGTH=34 /DNA_ID= /DNA_START= /DNA_END= /DNA_ORIENTATION=
MSATPFTSKVSRDLAPALAMKAETSTAPRERECA